MLKNSENDLRLTWLILDHKNRKTEICNSFCFCCSKIYNFAELIILQLILNIDSPIT